MKPCATCGVRRSVKHCYECGFDTCHVCAHSCEVTVESLRDWLGAVKPTEPVEAEAHLPSGTYHRGVQSIRPSFVIEALIAAAALIVFLALR